MCAPKKDSADFRLRRAACTFCLPERVRKGYNTARADLSISVKIPLPNPTRICVRDVIVGRNIFYECVMALNQRGIQSQIPKSVEQHIICDEDYGVLLRNTIVEKCVFTFGEWYVERWKDLGYPSKDRQSIFDKYLESGDLFA